MKLILYNNSIQLIATYPSFSLHAPGRVGKENNLVVPLNGTDLAGQGLDAPPSFAPLLF